MSKKPTINVWPDGTPKSQGNAFDLSTCPGVLSHAMRQHTHKAMAGRAGAQAQQLLVYSKAGVKK